MEPRQSQGDEQVYGSLAVLDPYLLLVSPATPSPLFTVQYHSSQLHEHLSPALCVDGPKVLYSASTTIMAPNNTGYRSRWQCPAYRTTAGAGHAGTRLCWDGRGGDGTFGRELYQY
jgi:hypothetical protein